MKNNDVPKKGSHFLDTYNIIIPQSEIAYITEIFLEEFPFKTE